MAYGMYSGRGVDAVLADLSVKTVISGVAPMRKGRPTSPAPMLTYRYEGRCWRIGSEAYKPPQTMYRHAAGDHRKSPRFICVCMA